MNTNIRKLFNTLVLALVTTSFIVVGVSIAFGTLYKMMDSNSPSPTPGLSFWDTILICLEYITLFGLGVFLVFSAIELNEFMRGIGKYRHR
jgi:hypothetical protein